MKIPWFNKFNGGELWELVHNTQVSLSFLTILEDRQVLTKSEVQEIKCLKEKSDNGAQRYLYDKLYNDERSRKAVIKALLETNQPGPARILLNKKKSRKTESSLLRSFCIGLKDVLTLNVVVQSNRSNNQNDLDLWICFMFFQLYLVWSSITSTSVDYSFDSAQFTFWIALFLVEFWLILALVLVLILFIVLTCFYFVIKMNVRKMGPDHTTVKLIKTDGDFKKGVENLDTYFVNTEGKVCVVNSENAALTLRKIKDTMTHIKIRKISTCRFFAVYMRHVFSFWQITTNQVFIMHGTIPCRLNISFRLLMYLAKRTGFRIIIIYEPKTDEILECDLLCDNAVIIYDTFSWDQLSLSCQQKILTRKVLDQGMIHTLNEIVFRYVYDNNDTFLKSFIRGSVLIELLDSQKIPVLFRQTIPATRHYVERTLRSRYCISRNIFQSASTNEIFAFEGDELDIETLREIGRQSLAKLDVAKDQLVKGHLTAKFILLEYANDFQKLCNVVDGNLSIHRLKYTKFNFSWMETYGNGFQELQKHICGKDDQAKFSENEIIDIMMEKENGSTLIICDSPGSGKSVLLASLARKIQKLNYGSVVLYFVMTDFMALFNQSSEISDVLIQKRIFAYLSTYKISHEVFSTKAAPSLHIFFDGLDELPVHMIDSALNVFQRIAKLYHTAKLCISTRPNLMHRLESSMSSLGFTIDPFHPSDQMEFLTRCWSNVDHRPIDFSVLEEYTENCLSTLHSRFTTREQDIIGVPLHCLLVAEVFEKEAIAYADLENRKITRSAYPRIIITSITELFNRMVDRKFKSYLDCYHKRSKYDMSNVSLLSNMHLYTSIEVIFGDNDWNTKLQPFILNDIDFHQLKQMCPDVSETVSDYKVGKLPRQVILAIGILEAFEDGKWQFVHRTYAEYIVASFAADILGNASEENVCTSFVNEAVLATLDTKATISWRHSLVSTSYRFKFHEICYFFDLLIQTRHPPISPLKFKDRNILTACVTGTFLNLFAILKDNTNLYDTEFRNKLLYLAAGYSSEKIFDLLPHKADQVQTLSPSVLHVAVEHGNFNIFSYLLNSVLSFINMDRQDLYEMISVCITNTTNVDHKAVTAREKILALLVKNSSSLQVKPQETMFRSRDPPDLLMETDFNDRSVLHLAAEYLEPSDYHQLVVTISNKNKLALSMLLKCRDIFGQTPLNYLLRYFDAPEATLQVFLEQGAEMNSIDNSLYTPLFNAIRFKRSNRVIEDLLSYSKEIFKDGSIIECDRFNRNPLHIAAQHAKDDQLITLLLKYFGVDDSDRYGNTPIFYAVCNQNSMSKFWRTAIFQLLKPANLCHRNLQGEDLADLVRKLENEDSKNVLRQLGYIRSP